MSTTRNTKTGASRQAGFTLVELLVSIGLMALLATLASTGYYAAARGMADRGVETDVKSIIRQTMQRALIDQVPTALIFYNQRLKEDVGDDGEEVVCGTAVAIRMAGRVSQVSGDYLIDEFADLNCTYPTNSRSGDMGMPLYRLNGARNGLSGCRTIVDSNIQPAFGSSGAADYMIATGYSTNVVLWAFRKKGGAGSWKAGDAYATEISTLRLPKGYYFGSTAPTQYEPKDPSGTKGLVFDPLESSMDGNLNRYEFNLQGSVVVSSVGADGKQRKVATISDVDDK